MFKSIKKFYRRKKTWLREVGAMHATTLRHSRNLTLKQNRLKKIKANDIILFAVMKNEAHRLSFFIDYYRKLGVNHFIFVDNDSTDNFDDIVADQDDISTFFTTASYKESNYGMYWANYLLLRYGCGHWCFTCDPDEFFVYPHMDTRNLRDLTEHLDSLKESSFFTTMIDMYSDTTVEESFYLAGNDPLETCPYFDSTGYSRSYNTVYRNTFIQGGVRRRIFYPDLPMKAPALNKIPLVKWQRHFAYVESMHMAIPRRLNEAFWKEKTNGALLHFKFISQLTQKVQEEAIAQQHWDNSSEYQKYGGAIKTRTILYEPSVSIRFENWQTLAKVGLINKGEW